MRRGLFWNISNGKQIFDNLAKSTSLTWFVYGSTWVNYIDLLNSVNFHFENKKEQNSCTFEVRCALKHNRAAYDESVWCEKTSLLSKINLVPINHRLLI